MYIPEKISLLVSTQKEAHPLTDCDIIQRGVVFIQIIKASYWIDDDPVKEHRINEKSALVDFLFT